MIRTQILKAIDERNQRRHELSHFTAKKWQNSSRDERDLMQLRGLQLRVFDFCFNTCVSLRAHQFPISYAQLALLAGIRTGSVRTTLKRLQKKKFLNIKAVQRGPGAKVIIELPPSAIDIYDKLQATKRVQLSRTKTFY